MGKTWDGWESPAAFQRWCAAWAAECLRVLKPGGHLLAFGGTRTYHRLACGIEDAGFEIRDSMHWIYGSGFPKSLDVSKAIDKRGGNDGTWFADWLSEKRAASGLSRHEVSREFPSRRGGVTGKVWNWEHGHGVPTQDEFDRLCDLLGAGRMAVFDAEREVIAVRHGITTGYGPGDVRVPNPRPPLSAAATSEAARWQGWGTALKPTHEPIVLARKPLAGTVAQNVLAYGTGALNVDGCRVEHQNGENPSAARRASTAPGREIGSWANDRRSPETFAAERPGEAAGRWPPNVLLGPEAAEELDRQSGPAGAAAPVRGTEPSAAVESGAILNSRARVAGAFHADSGGASRFFPVFRYQAKAAAHERPRNTDGTAHPTVKPVELMRWLVRLVTPPGGLVLDPFAGSGTTGEACIVEGFRCVLIEKDPASVELIQARLRKPIQPDMFGGMAS